MAVVKDEQESTPQAKQPKVEITPKFAEESAYFLNQLFDNDNLSLNKSKLQKYFDIAGTLAQYAQQEQQKIAAK